MALNKGNFPQNPDFVVLYSNFVQKSLHRVIIVLPGTYGKIVACFDTPFL